MGEFDDFTRKLRSDHEAKTADHEAEEARKSAERNAKWDGEIAMIEEVATPILEEAERVCKAQGLRPVILRNWEVHRGMNPIVEFQLFGPKKRPYDSSFYEIEANKALVRIEGDKIKSSVAKRSHSSSTGLDYIGFGAEGVSQAVKFAIASYFDEITPGGD